jgi:hypothetical protein
MKKISCLLTIITSTYLFSWTVSIDNTTATDMVVHVTYADNIFCSPDKIKVPAHQQVSKYVGACCTMPAVIVKNMTANTSFEYFPPTTGLGLSCRSWDAKIVENGNTFEVKTEWGQI